MEAFGNDQSAPESIALCLSGGGLRATFFHLGVITALREAGLLDRVREVYSVSGGSITAGHLALNWSRYVGTDKEFAAACAELRGIGDWDIRNRVLRRWLLGSWLLGYGRSDLLQKQYERLFGAETLLSCRLKHPSAPKFYVLATSFNTGDLCSFSDDDFTVHSEKPDEDGYGYTTTPVPYPGDNIRLSYAVAASSAFPPLFPPLRLTWDRIGRASEGGFSTIALTDGGVFDNLGFEKFATLDGIRKEQEGKEPQIDAVLISDAGGTFNSAIRDDFSGIIKRNVRATDVLMRRNAKATLVNVKTMRSQRRVARVSIGRITKASAQLETTQSRLQNIRTDLDRFSKQEVDMLVTHGRDVMRYEMKLPPDPLELYARQLNLAGAATRRSEAEEVARRGGTTRLRRVSTRDWASFGLVAVFGLAIWLTAAGINLVYSKVGDEIANYKAATARVALLTQDVVRLERNNAAHLSALGTALAVGRAPPSPATPSVPTSAPQAVDDAPAPAAAAAARPARSRYTVWIQFAGSLTRDQMKGFGARIRDFGWTAPGSEQGGERTGRSAGLNEIRYGPGTERKVAEDLAEDVMKTGIVPARIAVKRLNIIPDNSLEIWISN